MKKPKGWKHDESYYGMPALESDDGHTRLLLTRDLAAICVNWDNGDMRVNVDMYLLVSTIDQWERGEEQSGLVQILGTSDSRVLEVHGCGYSTDVDTAALRYLRSKAPGGSGLAQ